MRKVLIPLLRSIILTLVYDKEIAIHYCLNPFTQVNHSNITRGTELEVVITVLIPLLRSIILTDFQEQVLTDSKDRLNPFTQVNHSNKRIPVTLKLAQTKCLNPFTQVNHSNILT